MTIRLRMALGFTAAVRESRDLSRRVAHHGPADEVGRLRDTFNSMLAELETAHERLDRSNSRLRQFLADCSHELRAPLTLILSNLDLLAEVGATDPLLDNAFKYTAPPGEVRIETALEEGHARVTVTDTGSGIEPADLPRIFERFHRGANVDGVTGTGLGLAIARLVAEQHGGRIEVKTVPGQGSRFSLVLTLTDPYQPTAAPQEATLTSPTDE